jgi:hypothetical protein
MGQAEREVRLKPSKSPSVPIDYVDEMNAVDWRIKTLVELCRGIDSETADPCLIERVGDLFSDLLERKHIVEHFFLQRELNLNFASEARASAEVHYLRKSYPDFSRQGGH